MRQTFVKNARNTFGGEHLLSASPEIFTQKGVHAHPLTAREREHWILQHVSHLLAANFGRQ